MSVQLFVKVFYLVLMITVVSVMGYYVRGLTSKERVPTRIRVPFFGWVGFLALTAVSFHLLSGWLIPWKHWELYRHKIEPDREIVIGVKDHRFMLPDEGVTIEQGQIVKFKVLSEDLTYGFGLFRENGTMEFQMQVVPGHSNEIIWVFSQPGKYSIRSTEYAGVDTWRMYLKDAIEVLPGFAFAETGRSISFNIPEGGRATWPQPVR